MAATVYSLVPITNFADVHHVVAVDVPVSNAKTVAGDICTVVKAVHHMFGVLIRAGVIVPLLSGRFSPVDDDCIDERLNQPLIAHLVKQRA